MANQKIRGVLLVNLGTPKSPSPKDVFHYLNEFLTDGRVIDLPWFRRQCLVRGIIVPTRFRQSAALYQKIWTPEGSPLLIHGKAVKKGLQEALGDHYKVVLAMRYQHPSIREGMEELKQAHVDEIIIFPLFPQYASATTGSVHQKVMDELKSWEVIPKLTFVNSYPDHPAFIQAFIERAKDYDLDTYDHVLFSFHGLPERHLVKSSPKGKCVTATCCHKMGPENQFCYKAQCFATTRAITHHLNLSKEKFTICFQSRLGNDPWIQPYTSEVIAKRAAKGDKRILVFCPAFVADCLETSCEITHEYGEEFKKLGGEKLQLVEGLNSHPAWIDGLKQMILEQGQTT